MFSKILIANRGEIACRIIRTARRMGIQTVAVYSEADRHALHVRLADEAVAVGSAAAADSYLVIDRIVEACRQTGAQAVHPGYGFLSERAAFAQALQAASITFIGPNAHAMEAMGDKIESKRCASAAGVSTVPGYLGEIDGPEHAVQIADEIGYPVMIKASAGGGGKGMRIAWSQAEVAEGFERAKSEAASSFGDDRIFVEKFIVNPRHIEIQVLGDKHGNLVYLGERECSIQRRNQKVIEEAPSPLLDEATRRAMGEQAVALSRAVGYDSAGTVEFVVGQDRSFFFLEMNTRLQVEHPVTELVTGIDLVEQMIRVAAGEKLSLRQEDIRLNGWAVESRVYAEDPLRNFMPSTGRLTTYRPPAEAVRDGVTVRNDTGVHEGGEVSVYYDPMIAKLVTHAPSRAQAIASQAHALDAFAIEGIRHNLPFLSTLMRHPRWQEGRLSTGFISEEFPDGFSLRAPTGDMALRFAAIAFAVDARLLTRNQVAHADREIRRTALIGDSRLTAIIKDDGTQWQIRFGEQEAAGAVTTISSDWCPGQRVWQGVIGGEPVAAQLRTDVAGYFLSHAGQEALVQVTSAREAELWALMPKAQAAAGASGLLSPMPGTVLSVAVKPGQAVSAGEALCVIEAMKMEIVLRAERSAEVSSIHVGQGDAVAADAVIMEFV
ncbi:acetyl-CoA carboxylase biotin carboxylase subunit [Cupriavidus numazuensis]|uniref:propionyl-CoA carboxylase n=1 Tax=Cupriavidus numazuensis TaxID=221992 RepID=A0ABM8TFH0_9BURK|nr:acetyl/propionyl/methylcrotonyl-CoA carboxylase subunit alpha [Cupriavidus numazuensis]CAG2142717.1 Acetyl-/propionyl-coenzyme A carboxylase alpha chain [Cupriavidus numazuensis]